MPGVSSWSSLVSPRAVAAVLACAGIACLVGVPRGVAAASTDDDVRVVEGDILVDARPGAGGGFRGVGPGGTGLRWSYGEVPYRVDATLGPDAIRAVDEAVAHWNAVGGVSLVAVAPGASAPADHVVFAPGDGCASWVGRQGGAQTVWIGPNCTTGSVMHEIGHALGLEHEHTRPDRDQHVRVLWENVLPTKRHNFEPAARGALLYGDYDIDSIMHYGPANFSIDGRPTLEPLDPTAFGRMGQRHAPSAGDIAAIDRLYASDLALDVGVDDASAAREVTLFVTNQHAQGAHGVLVSLAVGGAATPFRLDASSTAGWRCSSGGWATSGGARIECRLARLGGGATSRLVLALDAPASESQLAARVSSRTPDTDLANNGGSSPDGTAPELGQALSAAVLANVVIAADDASGSGTGETSGGGAFGWLWLGTLAAGWRGRPRYCAGSVPS